MLRDLSVIDRVASSRRDSRNAEAVPARVKRDPQAAPSSRRDSRNAEAVPRLIVCLTSNEASSRRDSRNAEAAYCQFTGSR